MTEAPIVTPAHELRVAVASASSVGESPFWHPQEQALYYCDIGGHRLQRFEPGNGDLRHWDFDTDVACCAPRLGGGLLVATRDGLWVVDPSSGEKRRAAPPPYDPATERFNDGKCDPQGRFWVGTRTEPRDPNEPPSAALYCFTHGQLRREAEGFSNVNGLAWSPDGRTLYWSDTKTHTIFAADFDPAEGSFTRRRVFASFPVKAPGQSLADYGGRPDGAAMDVEGCYWVSMFEGQRVLKLSQGGQVLRIVELPVRCPTMPCFGGADLKTLYITTARENRPEAELREQPFAGCVLALDVDVAGLPVNFAG